MYIRAKEGSYFCCRSGAFSNVADGSLAVAADDRSLLARDAL